MTIRKAKIKDAANWFDTHVIVSMPDSFDKKDEGKIKEKLKQKLAKEMVKW